MAQYNSNGFPRVFPHPTTSLERTVIINFRKSRQSISSPALPTFSIFPSFAATKGLHIGYPNERGKARS